MHRNVLEFRNLSQNVQSRTSTTQLKVYGTQQSTLLAQMDLHTLSESVDVMLLRDNTSVSHDSETNFSLMLKGREGETQGKSGV